HKEVYERDVKAPMDALLAELTAEFGEPKLFRPYRDTRFSRDKSPYKTAIAATIGAAYVQVSADGLFAGGGMYHMMPDQLARFREAVASDRSGKNLEKVVATVTKSGLNVHAFEELKTAPKGYPKDHPRIGLLRMKGLVASRSWEPAAWLSTAGAKRRIVDALRATKPLFGWLDANVGPSTEDGTRR
ncbi:MAG TPA: DUF2461 domain-containing protein, partial [Acidimicrobiales bacterium]|nr:DUF2461 domain-containing protein [Acidimicrobiales bacterium]